MCSETRLCSSRSTREGGCAPSGRSPPGRQTFPNESFRVSSECQLCSLVKYENAHEIVMPIQHALNLSLPLLNQPRPLLFHQLLCNHRNLPLRSPYASTQPPRNGRARRGRVLCSRAHEDMRLAPSVRQPCAISSDPGRFCELVGPEDGSRGAVSGVHEQSRCAVVRGRRLGSSCWDAPFCVTSRSMFVPNKQIRGERARGKSTRSWPLHCDMGHQNLSFQPRDGHLQPMCSTMISSWVG